MDEEKKEKVSIPKPEISMWSQNTWLAIFLYNNFDLCILEIGHILKGHSGGNWGRRFETHIIQSKLVEEK